MAFMKKICTPGGQGTSAFVLFTFLPFLACRSSFPSQGCLGGNRFFFPQNDFPSIICFPVSHFRFPIPGVHSESAIGLQEVGVLMTCVCNAWTPGRNLSEPARQRQLINSRQTPCDSEFGLYHPCPIKRASQRLILPQESRIPF